MRGVHHHHVPPPGLDQRRRPARRHPLPTPVAGGRRAGGRARPCWPADRPRALSMSLTVISPDAAIGFVPPPGSFSSRRLCNSAPRRLGRDTGRDNGEVVAGSSAPPPSAPGRSRSGRPRWVRIPTSRPLPRSTTGKAADIVGSPSWRGRRPGSGRGWMVSGVPPTMPLSNFLTLRTCAACSSTVKFFVGSRRCRRPVPSRLPSPPRSRCPSPPKPAGCFSQISRVSRVAVRTDAGKDLRVSRDQQHIVEGQRLGDAAGKGGSDEIIGSHGAKLSI